MKIAVISFACFLAANAGANTVDFRYSPPEWQTAICPPDDPQKTIVDRNGTLLYHYQPETGEFGTRVSVEVVSNTVWQKQELHSPRVPIVRTFLAADGLQIVEEAFAVTDLPQPPQKPTAILQRMDDGAINRDWARPDAAFTPSLKDIALHNNGSIHYEVSGASYRIALALCEGWWDEAGKRVQILRVEGAKPKTVDTVAGIGKNKAAVFWFDAKDTNGDGKIDISVDADEKAADKNTVLNGLWVFPADMPADDQALLAGKLDDRAVARMDLAATTGPARNDLILVHVANTGKETRTLEPKLIVDTAMGYRLEDQHVVVNHHETVTSSLKMTGPAEEDKSLRKIPLASLTVAPGKTVEFFVLYSGGGKIVIKPTTVVDAVAASDHAIAYWENAPLPYGHVQVPDPGIQALVDSSIRNIWQAREIKKGLPAFQVGATCYRGLWIVDGAFILEAATLVGAGDQTRAGIMYTLSFQHEDGRFEILSRYHKENGIVLWTCVRHAMLTQDKKWLESVWPKLEKTVAYIQHLRKESYQDKSPLNDGLLPLGSIDGGIPGNYHYEYSNVYWNLLGLKSIIHAARWLGKSDEAGQWQKEYDDFYATFRKAAERDSHSDIHGNRYLPTLMTIEDKFLINNADSYLPCKAQWAFCHGVYPGQLFEKEDPLVKGNLDMLATYEKEGMVTTTGWLTDGIWNYFASFYGHALLWQGNGQKAAEVLYAYANHASPLWAWIEEQGCKDGKRQDNGDMPHNWASAEFIRLTVHLLALDRGDEMHLFEGMPPEWAGPGMTTKLDGIATPFGKLTMELKIADDGKTAKLRVEPLTDPSCSKIVVHLSGWANSDKNAVIELDPKKENNRELPITLERKSAGNQR